MKETFKLEYDIISLYFEGGRKNMTKKSFVFRKGLAIGIILLFVGFAILVMSAVTVSAVTETDAIGDVYDVVSDTIVSRPNIDITTLSYEINGDTATLTMTVNGNIMDSEYITYGMTLSNSTRLSIGYMMSYTNGVGMVLKDMTNFMDSEVSVSQGNTIIATFTLSEGEITDFEVFWGYNMERDEELGGRWFDYAPNPYSPYYSGDDDDDVEPDEDDDEDIILPNGDDTSGGGNGDKGGGTPGFEAIAVIAAVAVALIILRRKK